MIAYLTDKKGNIIKTVAHTGITAEYHIPVFQPLTSDFWGEDANDLCFVAERLHIRHMIFKLEYYGDTFAVYRLDCII